MLSEYYNEKSLAVYMIFIDEEYSGADRNRPV